MANFAELLSLSFPGRRYLLPFAHMKGEEDGKLKLPPWERDDAIADRLLAIPNFAAVYPNIPHSKDELIQWLSTKQRRFLAYLSELRNMGEAQQCQAMIKFQQQDIALKTRECITARDLTDAEWELKLFNEQFPDYQEKRTFAPRTYYIILVIIALLLTAFNQGIFAIFGEAALVTVFVSLAISLVMVGIAHWLGAVFKLPVRNAIDRNLMALGMLFLLAEVICYVIIREAYRQLLGDPPQWVFSAALAFFQVVMLLILVALSYFAHDIREDLLNYKDRLSNMLESLREQRTSLRKMLKADIEMRANYLNILLAEYIRLNCSEGGNIPSDAGQIILEIPAALTAVDSNYPEHELDCESRGIS